MSGFASFEALVPPSFGEFGFAAEETARVREDRASSIRVPEPIRAATPVPRTGVVAIVRGSA